MTDLNMAHTERLFDPRLVRPIELIGVGSVGSHLAMGLAKMGFTDMRVWDDDFVASHNIPASLYGQNDVGALKVHALKRRIESDTGVVLDVVPKKYEGESVKRQSIVIACVDKMTARKVIWETIRGKPSVQLYCDTRMNATYVEVLALVPNKPQDAKRFDGLWFPDSEASTQMCGAHGIWFSSVRAADVVGSRITQFLSTGSCDWRMVERCDTVTRVL